MRLYSLTGAIFAGSAGRRYEVSDFDGSMLNPDGTVREGKNPRAGWFDFPDDLSDHLQRVHVRGVKQWETVQERDARLHSDELARQRDPATLAAAVGELLALAKLAGARQADAAPARTTSAAKTAAATA